MVEALAICVMLGSCTAVTIAVLERRPVEEIGLWGYRGTAVGFLLGLFLSICCPESN
jgi:urea transporter